MKAFRVKLEFLFALIRERYKNIGDVLGDLMCFMLMGLSIIAMCYSSHFEVGTFKTIEVTFKDVPLILVTMLIGNVPAMVTILISIVVKSMTNGLVAYTSFVYIVISYLVYYFHSRVWLRKKIGSIIAIICLSFASGVGWGLMVMVTEGTLTSNFGFGVLWRCFLTGLIEVLVSFFLYYLLAIKAPKKLRTKFWNVNKIENITPMSQTIMHSKISKKISFVLVFSLFIMDLMAVVCVNYLIPTLIEGDKQKFEEYISKNVTTEESEVVKSSETDSSMLTDTSTGTEEKNFKMFGNRESANKSSPINLNEMTLAFDMKLFFLLASLSMSIGMIMNYLAQTLISKPIVELSSLVDKLGEMDEKSMRETVSEIHKLEVNSNDEIGSLYKSIDNMSDSLIDHLELIKEEQKLSEDLRVAKASSEAKSSFLSNMSHEIRTPINAILGMNEMILREFDDPKLNEYAVNIETSGHSLLSLVNDILDFSKIEAGKMEILPVEYDLSSVINDLINMSNPRAKAKNLELKVLVDETMPHMLYGDDVRIKQCALNILTNGVKYTEEGSVTLEFAYERLSDDMMNLIITVKDTGIGIKEEDIEKLYSPFERIEESRNRTIEGTGLGMNIVKQLLDLMGSKLDVSSVYGVGSVFSFTIKQRIIKDEPIGDFEKSYRKSIEDREKYQVQFRAPEAKILVVDDTALNLTVVKGLLKQTRVQIDSCESGFDALEMVRKNKYDCIFLDHRMPKMDGIETLQKMKEMDDNLNLKTPCVALTANAVSGARDVYMQAGFDDYISKPIDGTKLEHLLKTILPKELVYLPGDEGFDLNEVPLVTKKVSYDALDMKEAIQNCGSEELFVDVLKQYRDSIFDKADEIEKFYKERDYRNYTILVHALKSSSRLIGAIEISELAKELEAAGDREDSSFIEENTEKLLSMYRGLYEKIGGKEEEKRESDKPKISQEELDEIWGALKEMVEAFDFDSADGAYQALEEYLLPDEYQKLMPKLKKALLAVDRESLLEILG